MRRKVKDKVEFVVTEEDTKIIVYARITAQTIKDTNRKRQFVGLPEVQQYLQSQNKKYGRCIVNPGYIPSDGQFSEYVFEKVKEATVISEEFQESIKSPRSNKKVNS